MNSLLDTDVVSQSIKLKPRLSVVDWLAALNEEESFLSVVTLVEIRTGIDLLEHGPKRARLETWFENSVKARYAGRILPVTQQIAEECGRLVAIRRKDAKTPDLGDLLIAATALVHGLRVATLNRTDFEGLGLDLVSFPSSGRAT